MSDRLPINRPMQGNKTAQDAPRTIFSRGALLWYPPFSTQRTLEGDCRASTRLANFSQWKTVWTLPSLWTHRTRPQGTWKTAQTAVFHSAHTDQPFTRGNRTTKNTASVPNLIVSTEGFTPATWEQLGNNCARTPVKTRDQGRPASKTSQQLRQPCPVCKTSTPGSNPGGASNLPKKFETLAEPISG
jgi:hypothetical protein